MQRDNSTLRQKLALRRAVLRDLCEPPVILETHGGQGTIWKALYADVPSGVVFEKDAARAELLAAQRPTWAVYEADVIPALEQGVGGHLPVNLLDVDPYGDPWPALQAFFGSERPRPPRMAVAVNDGLRQKLSLGGGWKTGSMRSAVERFGNNLHGRYLDVCRWMLEREALRAGYGLERFEGYYCGAGQGMTHYAGVLTTSGGSS